MENYGLITITLYVKKKPDFFYAIRYLFVFIMLSNNQFCLKVKNCLMEENTYSYSINKTSIKYLLSIYFVNSGNLFSCYIS